VQSNAPTSTLFYPRGFRGTAEDRAAAAHLLERTFMKVCDMLQLLAPEQWATQRV
jgi:hypothetical protein